MVDLDKTGVKKLILGTRRYIFFTLRFGLMNTINTYLRPKSGVV